MPRRSILSVAERESLLSLPTSQDDLIRHYSLNESDLSLIRQRRGASNRLGFAILLSYMRYPGIILGVGDEVYAPLLTYVAQQVNVDAEAWNGTASASKPDVNICLNSKRCSVLGRSLAAIIARPSRNLRTSRCKPIRASS